MQRRLAAILAADVAGYSRLIGADEEGTLLRLRMLFQRTVRPGIAAHGGRVFKLMGDAVLAEFPSAVDAVRCAVALQAEVTACEAEDLRLRIGVHLGDVVVEGSDLLGDGVNVAARLEGEALPGGIALSAAVAEAVLGRVPQPLQDLGERRLKNIERPIRVFAIGGAAAPVHPALPDKPSLVVLPFQNMSGDAEQEYFADGMVEDITTALSRIRWLFVIARNSAFTYKGRAVDVRQVGRELGVRYVVEGSVRRAGDRVRITAQLVEAEAGRHIWADRFDGTLSDVFDLQDRVTEAIAGMIEPHLLRSEITRAQRSGTTNANAHDHFLRGLGHLHESTRDGYEAAYPCFVAATRADPSFAAAFAMAAVARLLLRTLGGVPRNSPEEAEALHLARTAAEKGRHDPTALCGAGATITYLGQAPELGIDLLRRACELNPGDAMAWRWRAYAENCLGRPEDAVVSYERALRLSPEDPFRAQCLQGIAQAHLQAGRAGPALQWAERAVADTPGNPHLRRIRIVALVQCGRIDEARSEMAEVLRLAPGTRIGDIIGPYRNPAFLSVMTESYRMAGMPD